MKTVMQGMVCVILLGIGLAVRAGTVYLDYTDPQGNVLAVADTQGHILERYDYRPYGGMVSGSGPDGPGYTGHVQDPETELIYMQQRYDDPLGRFPSPDPVGPAPGNVFSFNRYAYANNDPTTNVDPTGEYSASDRDDMTDCRVYQCETSWFGGNGGGGSAGAESSTSKATISVASVFDGYKISSSGYMTKSPIPPALLKALDKILGSPIGQEIAREAMKEGGKISVALEPTSISQRYQWDPHAFAILYTLDVKGFIASNDKDGELKGIGLDTIIIHEMGHTPYAAKALGYPYQAGYWQNEFNAVKYVENPYRIFIGAPVRTTYSGIPIPSSSRH